MHAILKGYIFVLLINRRKAQTKTMKLGDKIKTNYFGKTVEGVVTEMTTTNFTLTDDKGTKYCISASEFEPKYKAIEAPFKELADMHWSKAPKTKSNEDWRDSLNKFKNLNV